MKVLGSNTVSAVLSSWLRYEALEQYNVSTWVYSIVLSNVDIDQKEIICCFDKCIGQLIWPSWCIQDINFAPTKCQYWPDQSFSAIWGFAPYVPPNPT